ncbi:MAG: hypothetical protein E6Q97_39525 [Desulfurellales bacterium]|nr:MAG: hypothetical protein E6Q97_39525 [Desulfurellales bacterium]
MIENIAFILLFLIWAIAPPASLISRWNGPMRYVAAANLVFWWLLLLFVLSLMHAVTYGGIFRWNFWIG